MVLFQYPFYLFVIAQRVYMRISHISTLVEVGFFHGFAGHKGTTKQA